MLKNAAENMGAVAKYLPLSAFIIVMLLIIQFNSLRKMTMVVSTIPLGVIGMVIGLFDLWYSVWFYGIFRRNFISRDCD